MTVGHKDSKPFFETGIRGVMRQQEWKSYPGDVNTVIGILEQIRVKFCADDKKEWYKLCLHIFGDLFTCVREGPFP